jgi:hypothetical protein
MRVPYTFGGDLRIYITTRVAQTCSRALTPVRVKKYPIEMRKP